jgi:GNAT superfamily N-acetyltransferase
VRAMFREACRWLRAAGAGEIVGPMDGDTWHKYRLNVGPFDQRPFLMEPYNPSYYPVLWEQSGFAVFAGYHSKYVENLAAAAEGTKRIAERSESRGYRLRGFVVSRLQDELRIVYRLSCRIFARNFLYTDISEPAFMELYDGAERFVDSELAAFVVTPKGEEIGFIFSLPDLFEAAAAMRGRKTPLALLRYALRRGRVDALNVKTLGVVPEYQGTGVSLQLMHRIYRVAQDRGIKRVNLCLIKDGNSSSRMDGGQGLPLRRYHLYRHVESAQP